MRTSNPSDVQTGSAELVHTSLSLGDYGGYLENLTLHPCGTLTVSAGYGDPRGHDYKRYRVKGLSEEELLEKGFNTAGVDSPEQFEKTCKRFEESDSEFAQQDLEEYKAEQAKPQPTWLDAFPGLKWPESDALEGFSDPLTDQSKDLAELLGVEVTCS